MPTTEEELDEKRQRNQKLRDQLAAEEAKRVDRETSLANDVTAMQLDAEAVRLQAALDAAKEANKVSAVKEGAAPVLDAAKEDIKNAEAFAKGQEDLRAAQAQQVAFAKAAEEKRVADEKAAADAANKES